MGSPSLSLFMCTTLAMFVVCWVGSRGGDEGRHSIGKAEIASSVGVSVAIRILMLFPFGILSHNPSDALHTLTR